MKRNSIVFNYSRLVLTEPMEKLLNQGFNFSVLPNKLDITQLLVEYKRYERSAILNEFHHGEEQDSYETPLFKTHKTNMHSKYSVPEGLKVFLSSVKSKMLDPRNRNHIKCNLSESELNALQNCNDCKKKDRLL